MSQPLPIAPSALDYEDLLACARGEMFGPGNAQLPAPPMLMMDRITQITRDGAIGRGWDIWAVRSAAGAGSAPFELGGVGYTRPGPGSTGRRAPSPPPK
jgi:hypothetical protein